MVRAAIGLGFAVLVASCGTQTQGSTGALKSAEQWRDFDTDTAVTPAQHQLAGVVFMRDKNVPGKAANVFVNGEYLTSLLPGGFKQTTLCTDSNRLTVHPSDVSSRYREKEQAGEYFSGSAGVVSYFKVVSNSAGEFALQAVDAAEARKLLSGLKEQAHTISRVGSHARCAGSSPAAPARQPATPRRSR